LDDSILFGVNGPTNFVLGAGRDVSFITQTAQLQTVLAISWSSVVASGQDVLVFYHYGADMMP
jgi:hypothetical protein